MSSRIENPPFTPPVYIDYTNDLIGLGSLEGGLISTATLQVKTKSSGFALTLQENSGTESYQIGVTADGSLGFYNSLNTAAVLYLSDDFTVGINTTSPAASAVLDVTSTSKGFLPPRMTAAQKNAISSPATGLIVYDTDDNKLYCYTGAGWTAVF